MYENRLINEAGPETFGISDDRDFYVISKNYYKNDEKMTSQEVEKFFRIKNGK